MTEPTNNEKTVMSKKWYEAVVRDLQWEHSAQIDGVWVPIHDWYRFHQVMEAARQQQLFHGDEKLNATLLRTMTHYQQKIDSHILHGPKPAPVERNESDENCLKQIHEYRSQHFKVNPEHHQLIQQLIDHGIYRCNLKNAIRNIECYGARFHGRRLSLFEAYQTGPSLVNYWMKYHNQTKEEQQAWNRFLTNPMFDEKVLKILDEFDVDARCILRNTRGQVCSHCGFCNSNFWEDTGVMGESTIIVKHVWGSRDADGCPSCRLLFDMSTGILCQPWQQ